VRAGIFAHGLGSREKNTYDLDFELVSPRLPFGSMEWWYVLIPRLHVGGFLNMSGRTSAAYGGLLWTFPLHDRFFAEAFLGGAVNNGLADGSATRSALGCQGAFNEGFSLGYRLSSTWDLITTFNHMSNGNSTIGIDCPHNKGVNNVGIKLGYSF